MKERRGMEDIKSLTNGPGKLCKAMNITKELYGQDLTSPHFKLYIVDDGFQVNDKDIVKTGHKLGNPIYYRNYLYSENERDILWSMMLDKGKRYIFGIEIDILSKDGWNQYFNTLSYYREKNKELGYYTDPTWTIEEYSKRLQSLGTLKVNDTFT
jgi:hypothetical protein